MARALLVLLLLPLQDKPFGDDVAKLDLRVRPLEPAEALRAFRVEPGFRIELAAAEPQVADPVAAAWDEDGRLYVCQIGDYPYGVKPGARPTGKVVRLEDRDDDGRYETSVDFVDPLPWPSGVACWEGGVFVVSSPDVWYFKDEDGDGRAEVRRRVLTGFRVGAAEEVPNSLVWGIDNRIYGSASDSGGLLRTVDPAPPSEVRLRRQDFRFDPRTMKVEAVSGNCRFGGTFDDWGNRFIGDAGSLLRHPVLAEEDVARNPHLAVAAVTDNVSRVGRVHPLSGPEPWKVARERYWKRWVNTTGDMNAGRFPPQELAPQGFVTGAAGQCVYRGSAFPEAYRGNAFSGEPPNNVLVRLALRPAGASFTADREGAREFLASTDNWFRPVAALNGPDGSLVVLDMYREIIEYYNAIPEELLRKTDVTSGRDRGRIWRVVPEGFVRPEAPRLGKAGAEDLVALLGHADAWRRETAQRLLYERRDPRAVGPLRALVRDGKIPQARIHALRALEGMGALEEADLEPARRDPDARVREHAARLSEGRFALPLAGDADPRVRFQAALALGRWDGEEALGGLAAIARKDAGDRWTRTAVALASGGRAAALFHGLASDAGFAARPEGAALLGDLVGIVASAGRVDDLSRIVRSGPEMDAALRRAMTLRLAEGLSRSGRDLGTVLEVFGEKGELLTLVATTFREARLAAADPSKPLPERVEAARLLAHDRPGDATESLALLSAASQPLEVQRAAVQAYATRADPGTGGELVARWRGFSPAVRPDALEAFFRRPERLPVLLGALEEGRIPAGELPAARRLSLVGHRDPAVAERARKVLGGAAEGNRKELVERYAREMAGLEGDAGRGALVFEKNCAPCHAAGGKGTNVAPDLAGTNRLTETLLANILDPNRDVPPGFLSWTVVTRDGTELTGIVAEETATSVTIRRAGGEQDAVLRKDIRSMSSSSLSFMPEGLEKAIDPRQMADLVRYLLRTVASGPPK